MLCKTVEMLRSLTEKEFKRKNCNTQTTANINLFHPEVLDDMSQCVFSIQFFG